MDLALADVGLGRDALDRRGIDQRIGVGRQDVAGESLLDCHAGCAREIPDGIAGEVVVGVGPAGAGDVDDIAGRQPRDRLCDR